MQEATVVRNEAEGTQLHRLSFDRAPLGYTRPGQFVTLHLDSATRAFFALASSPGESTLLLVKDEGPIGSRVAGLQPGAGVTISDAMGTGFPLERVEGRELVILCNGSAISAVRPVLRQEVALGLPRPVHFYYGVFTLDQRAFVDEIEAWEAAGVHVHTVLATPHPGWAGATGYVQELAATHGLIRPDVGAVLVGVPEMVTQARARFVAAGCPDEHVLVNF
jgi:NAD(P)H-flavin reductase